MNKYMYILLFLRRLITVGQVEKRADPDQILHLVVSDLSLHGLLTPVIMVLYNKNLKGCLWKQRTHKRTKVRDLV